MCVSIEGVLLAVSRHQCRIASKQRRTRGSPAIGISPTVFPQYRQGEGVRAVFRLGIRSGQRLHKVLQTAIDAPIEDV
jgi:hypothetical protein